MTRITHTIAGLTIATAYIGLTKDYSVVGVVPILIAGFVGGTFPDIDYHLGNYGKKTIFRHRGICHTLLFLALCIVGLVFFERYIKYNFTGAIIVFGLAFLSHLFLDSFTFVGLPLFYPLTDKTFCLKLFKVGSPQEYGYVTFPLILALFVLSLFVFHSDLGRIFQNQYFLRRIAEEV
jgi:inner membrane protein